MGVTIGTQLGSHQITALLGRGGMAAAYDVLDTVPEEVFDDLTELAARICEAQIELVAKAGRKKADWTKTAEDDALLAKIRKDFAASIHAHGYGDAFFPQPEPLIQGPATRVMSLRDGSKKMSKSEASDYSRINLTDDADAIAQKIRKAKTDPEPLPGEEKGLAPRPEADNLVGIYAALQGVTKAEVLGQFGGGQFSTFKTALVDLAVAKLGPIGAEMKKLVEDPVYIDSVLVEGSQRAQAIAAETMKAVKDIVGFVHR